MQDGEFKIIILKEIFLFKSSGCFATIDISISVKAKYEETQLISSKFCSGKSCVCRYCFMAGVFAIIDIVNKVYRFYVFFIFLIDFILKLNLIFIVFEFDV